MVYIERMDNKKLDDMILWLIAAETSTAQNYGVREKNVNTYITAGSTSPGFWFDEMKSEFSYKHGGLNKDWAVG